MQQSAKCNDNISKGISIISNIMSSYLADFVYILDCENYISVSFSDRYAENTFLSSTVNA